MEINWESHYTQLKKDIQDVRKSGKRCTATELSRFEDRFKKLDKGLQVIKSAPMEYEVSNSELERRMMICDNLKSLLAILSPLDLTPRNSSASTINSAPGGGASFSAPSGQSIRPIATMQESLAMNPLQTERDLIRKQEYVMKQQDQALAEIEQGVGRLKNKAMEIGEDIKIQNVMLDGLDAHVDAASEGLKEETKHAEAVRIKGQVCYMYICVVVEVVIILIMAFLFFKV